MKCQAHSIKPTGTIIVTDVHIIFREKREQMAQVGLMTANLKAKVNRPTEDILTKRIEYKTRNVYRIIKHIATIC